MISKVQQDEPWLKPPLRLNASWQWQLCVVALQGCADERLRPNRGVAGDKQRPCAKAGSRDSRPAAAAAAAAAA